jgi:periplasmic protein TonB
MNTTPLHQRPIVIASAVALLHVGGLAALQSGLLVRVYEVIVPVEMISQIIEPPKPILPAPVTPPTPVPSVAPSVAPAPASPSAPQPAKRTPALNLPPAPQPQAIAEPTPSPHAPVVSPAPAAPLPPITAPMAATPSPAAAPAAPDAAPAPTLAAKVELPRADADYLNNPRPPYPPVSKRMGEQGRVMVRVFVGEDGLPQKSELRSSSGFDRLDATAVATVMRWRFRPGTRGGAPEAMWVNVPIDFTLDN